jgi:tRNA(Ile)-lysidine synthase
MTRRRRSHPPTLLKLIERTLRAECALPKGTRILVAVSGGGDSQALLHALARLAPRLGLSLVAHGVDHGLRPAAAAELDLAEALAASVGVPFTRSRVKLAPGGNLMARARARRYQALRGAARDAHAAFIATAHHADDRAETVLLRLLRGAGPRGLAVLPPKSDDLLRPMLRARRTDVQGHLRRHGIEFASDPTNEDPRYLRARVRHELVPLLESLSPKVVSHLTALADELVDAAPPLVHGPDGAPVPLGRAQARALSQLRRTGSSDARIWLPGGRTLRLDPETGAVRVLPAGSGGAAIRRKSD